MPKAETEFECDAPAERVMRVLQDITFLASVVPGVQKVEKVDDRTALWTVTARIGFLERTSIFRGEILETTAERVEFRATSPDAVIHGKLQVREVSPGCSVVGIRLDASGQGTLKPIVDNILARRLNGDIESLSQKLRGVFATQSSMS